ncbi:hypothetical protein PSHT_10630 [Puccinia striiformis]|uniref:Uncharacterized protein n=1 Tax=Puccinia striiformis TaxID=27350 RepID=A0A2S4V8D3_9BASI|nr:hypothetical protein PSHT_10630 [Puccinia striiformis]
MAFSLPMVSILMSWISYSAVSAHPFGMFGGGGTPGMSGGMSGLGGGGGMPGFGGGGMPGLGGGGGMSGMADGLGAMSTGIGGAGGASEDKSSSNSIKTEFSHRNLQNEGSIVSAINTWVTGACAAVPCSKDALASAAEKIKKDCQKDLDDGSAGHWYLLPHPSLQRSQVRRIFCSSSSNERALSLHPRSVCDLGTHFALKPRATRSFVSFNYEALEARLAKSSPMQGSSQPWLVKLPPKPLPSSVFQRYVQPETQRLSTRRSSNLTKYVLFRHQEAYCTPCTHALGTQSEIMVEAISKDPKIKFEHSTTQAKGKASEICGASFDDKKIPDSIQIAAPGNGKADAPGGKAKADGPKDTEVAPEKKPKDADASATKPLDAGAGAGAGTETPKDGPTTPENSESTKEATEKPKAEESSSEEA